LAKELGFDETVNSNQALNPLQVDKIFLCAGNNATLDFAVTTVRDGGTILVFSSVGDDLKGFTNNDIYYRELTILGSYSPSPKDLEESLKLIEKGMISLGQENKKVEIYSLSDIITAIDDTMNNKVLKAYIKI
jgi:threonine dehydrogenase-like Zn-dependent dehydrogenase